MAWPAPASRPAERLELEDVITSTNLTGSKTPDADGKEGGADGVPPFSNSDCASPR